MKVVPTFEYKITKSGRTLRFFQNMNATEHVRDVVCAPGVSDAVKRQGIQAITDIAKSQAKGIAAFAALGVALTVLVKGGKYVVCRIENAINEKKDNAVIGNGSVE